MKAVIQDRYGTEAVLRVADVAVPVPLADEVLVRVHASSVHADVWHCIAGRPYALRLMGGGLLRPRQPIPGTDAAGVVESLGADVAGLQVGDRVFGEVVRGHAWKNGGALAEYVCAPSSQLVVIPERLSDTEAGAAAASGVIAMQVVQEEGMVAKGDRVLINGAGGALGTIAVQAAAAAGATVTAVDRADKLELLTELGAQHTIDYTAEAVTGQYDVVIDVASTLSTEQAVGLVASGGRYVFVGHDDYGARRGRWLGSIGRILQLLWARRSHPQLSGGPLTRTNAERMRALAQLIDDGVVTPVVDPRTFRLDGVPDAMRYLKTGDARGRVVVELRPTGARARRPARG